MDSIIQDKALREQFAAEVERLKAEFVPGPERDTVVELFGRVAP